MEPIEIKFHDIIFISATVAIGKYSVISDEDFGQYKNKWIVYKKLDVKNESDLSNCYLKVGTVETNDCFKAAKKTNNHFVISWLELIREGLLKNSELIGMTAEEFKEKYFVDLL